MTLNLPELYFRHIESLLCPCTSLERDSIAGSKEDKRNFIQKEEEILETPKAAKKQHFDMTPLYFLRTSMHVKRFLFLLCFSLFLFLFLCIKTSHGLMRSHTFEERTVSNAVELGR